MTSKEVVDCGCNVCAGEGCLGLDEFEFESKTKRRIMLGILGLLATIISILLMLIILVQRGKGGGLTGALGGMGGQSAFGAKAGDVFTRVTVFAAIIWMTCCLLIIRVYNPPPARAATKKGSELSAYEEDDSDAGISSGVLDGAALGSESSGIGELLESDPNLSSDPDDTEDFNPGLPSDGEGGAGSAGSASPDSEFRVDPDVEESPATDEQTPGEPSGEAGSGTSDPAEMIEELGSTPVESAPVESAPVESAPVESAPVESAPVESAPVESAPVDAGLSPEVIESVAPQVPDGQ